MDLGVMVSIARSRYTILLQFCFFALHSLGMTVGTIYNANTPDLYENNAHHKMGWIFTWISLAWILLSVVNMYTSKRRNGRLSISEANMARYHQLQQNEEESHP